MALDEALLLGDSAPVTLRLYTWAPDTLSLGYFQRLVDVPPAAHFLAGERGPSLPGALVRRLTGGGAIHHQHELTFSLTAPLTHALYQGRTEHSYQRVHAAIASALLEVGVVAKERGDRQLASERARTGMCFHKSAAVDLCWDDRKGVGSAQRRTGGRVLHHGSIKLGTTPLEGDIATAGAELTPEVFAPTLLAAFARAFGVTYEPTTPSADEVTRAEAREVFFTSPAFVGRR